MKTGFEKLDEKVNFNRGDLIVVAGRPAIGKSTYGINIINNLSKQNIKVAVFNLETSKETLLQNLENINNIYIDDTPNITVNYIEEKCKKLIKENNIKFVLIDYIQLVKKENIEICSKLKTIAKELNITILALSQLSYKVEEREDKRPVLADIKDEVVKNADMIMFLYREDYHNKENNKPNTFEIIVSKNNTGELGTAEIEVNRYIF